MAEQPAVKAWPLTCEEAAKRAGVPWICCDSCHDDADHWGFELLEVDMGGVEAYVCCAIDRAIERAEPPDA